MAVSLQAETCLLHSVPISWATVCLSTKDSCFFIAIIYWNLHLKNGVKVAKNTSLTRKPKWHIDFFACSTSVLMWFHLHLFEGLSESSYQIFHVSVEGIGAMVFFIRTWSLTECWIPHMSYRVSRWFLSHHYILIHFVVKVRELAVAL